MMMIRLVCAIAAAMVVHAAASLRNNQVAQPRALSAEQLEKMKAAFVERISNTKFDVEHGKRMFKLQQQHDVKWNAGTQFNADGMPKVTKFVVSETAPTGYYNSYYYSFSSTCAESYPSYQVSTGYGGCVTQISYDHNTTTASNTDFFKETVATTSSGFTVTTTFYTDNTCGTEDTNSSPYVSTYLSSCTDSTSGGDPSSYYGDITDSYTLPNADGYLNEYYATAGCGGIVYQSYWTSIDYAVYMFVGVEGASFGECIDLGSSSAKLTCESDGSVKVTDYSTTTCSGTSQSGTFEDGVSCETTRDDDRNDGDDDYTSYTDYMSYTCTEGSSSSKKSKCFAGSELVTLESGASLPISDVQVGDRVLSASKQGEFRYSEVIAVPHAKNNDREVFHEIRLANGADVRMTAEHLLPVAGACAVDAEYVLTAAKDVTAAACVMTVNGPAEVVANNHVVGYGIYTIITKEEYVVVNGVVASPFAVSHAVANSFYNMYRVVYEYAPGLFKSAWFQAFHATFAHLSMKTW